MKTGTTWAEYLAEKQRLEAWANAGLKWCLVRRYNPSVFESMRRPPGFPGSTDGAMKVLVVSGEIRSGFIRLIELGGHLEWSVEAGIGKFPLLFEEPYQEAAQWRLDNWEELWERAKKKPNRGKR